MSHAWHSQYVADALRVSMCGYSVPLAVMPTVGVTREDIADRKRAETLATDWLQTTQIGHSSTILEAFHR